jgi:hypothetical protein
VKSWVNSGQTARDHTPRLAVAAVAIHASRRRSGAENAQSDGGERECDESVLSIHGDLLLWRSPPAADAGSRFGMLYPAMAKSPTKPETHSWAVHHLKGTPSRFVGIVHNQLDEESAIKQAIEEFKVPPNQRGRLIAQRRD